MVFLQKSDLSFVFFPYVHSLISLLQIFFLSVFYTTAPLQHWKFRPSLPREVGLYAFKFPSIKERPGFATPFSVAQKQPALLGAL